MKDLFEREDTILNDASEYLHGQMEKGASCGCTEYAKLVREYARILKLIKRMTIISDKTTEGLNGEKNLLYNKAHFDVLTGIYNRLYFEEEYGGVIKKCVQNGKGLGLLMIDADHFKRYNDTYGHGEGDVCLKRIAAVLVKCAEEREGFAVRYGGEEFMVVLPGADNDVIIETAEQIRRGVMELQILHEKNDEKEYMTISVGAVGIEKVVETKKDYYVQCADVALYESKQTGRNKYTFQKLEEK